MALKIRSKDEPIKAKPPVCTIFGVPGVGKTTLTFTAPRGVLHLDFDEGVMRADKTYLADSVDPYEYKDYGEFKNYIMSDKFVKEDIEVAGFKTVVIDTVGTMLDDFIAPWLMKVNPKNSAAGGLSLQGWGALKREYSIMLQRLRSLGLYLVQLSHESDLGEDSVAKYGLAISGGTKDIVMRKSDMVGFVYMHPQHGRYLDFNTTHLHIGKNSGNIEPVAVPHVSDPSFENLLADLIQKTQDEMDKQSKAAQEVRKVMDILFATIDEAKTPEDFDEIIAEITNIESKTIKAQVKVRLNHAMEFHGVKYDKDQGKVVKIKEEKEDAKENVEA